MFTVYRAVREGRSRLFSKGVAEVTEHKSLGVFYYDVTVKYRGKSPDKSAVANVLCELGCPVIGVSEIPEYSGIEKVNGKKLIPRLLSNAVASLGVGSVALCDRFGEYPECLYPLLSGSRSVCVITRNPSVYASENIRAYSELGASAYVCTRPPEKRFDIMFSPFSNSSRVNVSAPFLVGEDGFCLGYDIGLPKDCDIPVGVNPIDFAYALYNFCGVKKIAECVPSALYNKNTDAVIRSKKVLT